MSQEFTAAKSITIKDRGELHIQRELYPVGGAVGDVGLWMMMMMTSKSIIYKQTIRHNYYDYAYENETKTKKLQRDH